GITFDELIDNLVKVPNMDNMMSKRTFHNYLKELRDRFGIKIECDKRLQYDIVRKSLSEENRRYRYRIVEVKKIDHEPWTRPFIMAFETAAAVRQLQDSEEDKKYMYIDCKATGIENMNIMLDAIHQQKCVELYYHPRNRFPYKQDCFEPRGLVMKDYVWYVLGHNYRMEVIWPLSRISGVRIRDIESRSCPDFSPEKFWKEHKDLWLDNIT
ncbi:MAG: WYL domain-containing protein, partial [Bacteroidales bacterium]|nr:WYL domain-containing protein [Bacteroidales bacterium]